MSKIEPPGFEHFCDLHVKLGDPIELGPGNAGKRRIIPIVGGTAEGPHFTGTILNFGADWQTVHENGLAHLDTRYAITTSDGATIEVINRGLRHGPAEIIAALARGEEVPTHSYYMRTHATLETGDARYNWINKYLFVGTGARNLNSVDIRLFVIR